MSEPLEPTLGEEFMEPMGMTAPSEVGQEEPISVQPEETEVEDTILPEGTDVDDLYKAREVKLLVDNKDNDDAQLAAMVLMSNQSRNFNVRSEDCISWITLVDIGSVSRTLELDEETSKGIELKRDELVETFSEFSRILQEIEKFSGATGYSIDYLKKKYKKEIQALNEQESELESVLSVTYRELMLPIRTAVINSGTLPEQYKIDVIEGIRGYSLALQEEYDLLKGYYPGASQELRKQIADTVAYNIGSDLKSLDVVPFEDLEVLGVDVDKFFFNILANPQTTGEFVEARVAPLFLPDEDPRKVRECWEALRGVTALSSKDDEKSFVSQSSQDPNRCTNIDFFKNFVENSTELIPVMNLLSNYGFSYKPLIPLVGELYPEYIERLKQLSRSLEELKEGLDLVKTLVPGYKYNFQVNTRYSDIKGSQEIYLDDNPFSLALKQKIYPSSTRTNESFNQAVELFDSLSKVVPERWKSGFITTYIDLMSSIGSYDHLPQSITSVAIAEANKYIFDSSVSSEDVDLFATLFFEASLKPKNGNVPTLFRFCDKYADKVRTKIGGSSQVDANSTWLRFSLIASDPYRYPIISGKEADALKKAKTDMLYVIGAISRIADPAIRDKAIYNIVSGLTDADIGYVDIAQFYLDMMEDERLKEDVQSEIQLELERARLGESTTWKKMEKVRRTTADNIAFLMDLFGYSSAEALQLAQTQYRKKSGMYLSHRVPYSDERKTQLEQEIERIKDEFHVTLNITWENILGILESGRVLSIWENPEMMEYRNNTAKYHYGTRRDEIERKIGNRAKGGRRDPHPIYGAGASPNGRDEFYGGTGGGYGECFLVLKTDKIKPRTSFCYDDSFNGYNAWLLDWNTAVIAKAMFNLDITSSMHGYVEAQILGGVTLEDIDSINIPSCAIYEKNEYGWSLGTHVLSEIEEIKQKYPGIEINIIETPKEQT